MKSSITRVTYGKTINVGNYESVRIDLSAEVYGDEKWQDVLIHLKGLMVDEERKAKGLKNNKRKNNEDYDYEDIDT